MGTYHPCSIMSLAYLISSYPSGKDRGRRFAIYLFEVRFRSSKIIFPFNLQKSRSAAPVTSMVILNRLSVDNFIHPIIASMDVQIQSPYLLFKNQKGSPCSLLHLLLFHLPSDSTIKGIWFFEKSECARIGECLKKSPSHSSYLIAL